MDIFYNDTVTVYNKYEDKASGRESWYPTVLNGVRLTIKKGANITETGLKSADGVCLSINTEALEKPYILPKEWERLSEKSETFTLKEGDFFVYGDTDSENTGREDFAEYMKKKYDNCFDVSTIDNYKVIPHLEVGGR